MEDCTAGIFLATGSGMMFTTGWMNVDALDLPMLVWLEGAWIAKVYSYT